MTQKQKEALKSLVAHFGYEPKVTEGMIGYPDVILCQFKTMTVVVESDGHAHS